MFIRSVEWLMLVVPWISLLFLSKQKIKRYMPVTLFTVLLVMIYHEIAFTQKFWVGTSRIFPWLVTYASFVFGPFMVGTLWIFSFTFRRFWLYFLTNIVIDSAFLFVISNWFERMGFYHLINRTHWMILIEWLIISVTVYCYQIWQSGSFGKQDVNDDSVAPTRSPRFKHKVR